MPRPNRETLQAAARTLGLQLHVLHASTERDFDTAFATLVQLRAGRARDRHRCILHSAGSNSSAALALRHAVPTICQYREFAAAGGLMSYGGSITDDYRLVGDYTGRILKGEKPADLPVQQATRIELIINMKTAKAARPHLPDHAARPRRRGDRMSGRHETMRRRDFIKYCWLAPRGRSRRMGSRPESCRPSGSWARARASAGANGSPLLCSGCANSAGSRVAPSRSSIAGRRDATSASPRSRPSSSGSRSMSLSRRNRAVLAAKQATSVIPIVFAVAGDPVGTGLVASLARPGGNVTGLSIQQTDLAGKRLELLREVVPGLRRLAIMANVGNPVAVLEMGEVQAAARTLGLEVATLEIRRARGYRARLRGAQGPRRTHFMSVADALVITNRVRINTLALGARLPTMHGFREYVEAGGLMSYGPNFPDLFRRAADYVDKILRGAKPGDIPVEQPTKFDLVMNLTTAKALGLEVPPTLLARADEVIEEVPRTWPQAELGRTSPR